MTQMNQKSRTLMHLEALALRVAAGPTQASPEMSSRCAPEYVHVCLLRCAAMGAAGAARKVSACTACSALPYMCSLRLCCTSHSVA